MGKTKLRIAFLAAVALMLIPAVAAASFTFSNASVQLVQCCQGPVGSSGEATVNYVKGRGLWHVTGSVQGLVANQDYYVTVGVSGVQPAGELTVATFTTDADGNGSFSARFIDLRERPAAGFVAITGLTDEGGPDFTAMRVKPVGSNNVHLTSNMDPNYPAANPGSQGSITFNDSQRGE